MKDRLLILEGKPSAVSAFVVAAIGIDGLSARDLKTEPDGVTHHVILTGPGTYEQFMMAVNAELKDEGLFAADLTPADSEPADARHIRIAPPVP